MDEMISNLQAIFPTWEKSSLIDILQSNDMSLNRSIETILSIESSEEGRLKAPSNHSKTVGIDSKDNEAM